MEVGDALYALNDDDLAWFRRLVSQEVARVGNTQNRSTRDWIEDEECPAPEVYVALVPAGGIAAFSPSGGGFGTLQGPVFSARCDIFRLLQVGTQFYLSPIGAMVGNNARTVYNLTTVAIAGSTYVLVERDKFGSWWIAASGGGGGGGGPQIAIMQFIGQSPDNTNLYDGSLYTLDPNALTFSQTLSGGNPIPVWGYQMVPYVDLSPNTQIALNFPYGGFLYASNATHTPFFGAVTNRPLYIIMGGWIYNLTCVDNQSQGLVY